MGCGAPLSVRDAASNIDDLELTGWMQMLEIRFLQQTCADIFAGVHLEQWGSGRVFAHESFFFRIWFNLQHAEPLQVESVARPTSAC